MGFMCDICCLRCVVEMGNIICNIKYIFNGIMDRSLLNCGRKGKSFWVF